MQRAQHPLSKGTIIFIQLGVGLEEFRVINVRDKESYLYDVAPLTTMGKRVSELSSNNGTKKSPKKKSKPGILKTQIRLHPTMQVRSPSKIYSLSNWGLASDFRMHKQAPAQATA